LKFYDSEKLDLANVLDLLATESKKINADLFDAIFEDTYQNTNNITPLSINRGKILIREITPTVLETISLILLFEQIGKTCGKIVTDAYDKARDEVENNKVREVVEAHKTEVVKEAKEIVADASVKNGFQRFFDVCICGYRNTLKMFKMNISHTKDPVKEGEINKIMYEWINQEYNSPKFLPKYFSYLKDQESYMFKYIKAYIPRYLKFYVALKSNIAITDEISELVKKIPEIPKPLLKSLEDLAKRSQVKMEEVETQLSKFQVEVEDWFDRSMTRASGVYKRNAKLVAFMIGLIIAITTNADTLHIVDRLAKDQVLRESVNRSVDQIVTKSVDQKGELSSETKGKIKIISDQISLPIGWGKDNINPQQSIEIFGFLYISPWILRVFGWVISGIAISMGASFWYDLLGKFIDIKNVGKKTPNSSDSSNSSNQN